jgi:hypothetical protein
MSGQYSGLLLHSDFTRRRFIAASAGAALAASLPVALQASPSAAGVLSPGRRAVYEALVETVALVPMNEVVASEAGRAGAVLAQVYGLGGDGRRQAIDDAIDAVPGTAGAAAFISLSPPARVSTIKSRLEREPANGLLRDALNLTAMPFGRPHSRPPIGPTFAYLGAG